MSRYDKWLDECAERHTDQTWHEEELPEAIRDSYINVARDVLKRLEKKHFFDIDVYEQVELLITEHLEDKICMDAETPDELQDFIDDAVKDYVHLAEKAVCELDIQAIEQLLAIAKDYQSSVEHV